MIPVRRLGEPGVLAKNKVRWRDEYLAERAKNPGKKPRNERYAHKEVVAALEAMSFNKCFYCEQSTKLGKEVDHHVEVAERPDLAFEWTNLYLCCGGGKGCNREKIANKSIPAGECLDPCDPSARPGEHLTFEDECIFAKEGSNLGLRTIQKYRLDRDALDHARMRQLRVFDRELRAIHEKMIAEHRDTMREDEKEALRSFRQPDRPFSLMFSVYLAKLGM